VLIKGLFGSNNRLWKGNILVKTALIIGCTVLKKELGN